MEKLLGIIVFTACFSSAVNGQRPVENDSAVVLKPVVVETKPVRPEIITYKTDGGPAFNGLSQVSKMVCLLNDLPEGKMKSVTFYFNSGLINLMHKRLNIDYQDVKLGLLVYEVAEDGNPGAAISEDELEFTITADHRGAYKLNVEELNLQSRQMYFGVSVKTEMADDENKIYVRLDDDEEARCFVVFKNRNGGFDDRWYLFMNSSFKMKIEVEQAR